jgi:hypothetical protein
MLVTSAAGIVPVLGMAAQVWLGVLGCVVTPIV